MRSRYSAYALIHEKATEPTLVENLIDFLVDTTHHKSRSKELASSIKESQASIQWRGLTIVNTTNGGEKDKVGKVEFIAQCLENGHADELHELSRFCRYQGNWVYLDGIFYERKPE